MMDFYPSYGYQRRWDQERQLAYQRARAQEEARRAYLIRQRQAQMEEEYRQEQLRQAYYQQQYEQQVEEERQRRELYYQRLKEQEALQRKNYHQRVQEQQAHRAEAQRARELALKARQQQAQERLQVLNKAAVKIQAVFRGYKERKSVAPIFEELAVLKRMEQQVQGYLAEFDQASSQLAWEVENTRNVEAVVLGFEHKMTKILLELDTRSTFGCPGLRRFRKQLAASIDRHCSEIEPLKVRLAGLVRQLKDLQARQEAQSNASDSMEVDQPSEASAGSNEESVESLERDGSEENVEESEHSEGWEDSSSYSSQE